MRMGAQHAPATEARGPDTARPTSAPATVRRAPAPLPAPLQGAYESMAGVALDDVEVHYDSPLPERIGAHAYTQGTRIHLAHGQEEHLAHEAWHTVQQMQSRVSPTGRVAGKHVNTDQRLEVEADRMSSKVSRIMRAVDRPAREPEVPTARIRRATRAPDLGRAPIQGVWNGLSAEELTVAQNDAVSALLMWAQRRQAHLDQMAALGANLLARLRSVPSPETSSVFQYLSASLDSDEHFSPDHLLRQIPSQTGLFAQDAAGLDGPDDDHVEDDHAPAPEEPISLHNLDHLALWEIRDNDPVLLVIAQRILAEYDGVPPPAGRTVKQWLEYLQDEVDIDAILESDAESESEVQYEYEYEREHDGGDEGLIQGKFKAGTVSGPKTYVGDNAFAYTGVSYTRDAKGSIDFGTPTAQTAWSNPMTGAVVDLTSGSSSPTKGLLQNGNEVGLKKANRNQHFDIANRIVGNGLAGVSPPGRTWHHLLTRFDMILVDRTVHREHGHNGGVLIW
jgi:hypothetical protein